MGIYHSLINKAVAMHDEGRVAHHHHCSTPLLNIARERLHGDRSSGYTQLS